MMTSVWAAYEAAFKLISPKMGEVAKAVAAEFGGEARENIYAEDYGWSAGFTVGGASYALDFQLWDAGTSAGDADAGKKGNIHLSVTRDGGRIVIGWAPHNYTPECWVSYADHAEELLERVSLAVAADIIAVIRADNATRLAEAEV